MGVISYDVESLSSIPAVKLYQKFIIEGKTVLPKALPQHIKSVEILEGDGGAGTIVQTTFVAENKFVKHKIEELDKEKLTYSYSISEGEYIKNGIESINYHMEVVPSDDGGSIVKNNTTFTTKEGTLFPEEEAKLAKDRLSGLLKAVEAYLLANP